MRSFKEAHKLKQKAKTERKSEPKQNGKKVSQNKKPKIHKSTTTTAPAEISTKIVAAKAQPPCSMEVLSEGVPTNLAKPSGIAKFFKSSSSSTEEGTEKVKRKRK